MKTMMHMYYFDIGNADEAAQYAELKASLKQTHPPCMRSHGGDWHYQKARHRLEVTLETEHLFNDQWNTAPVEGVSDKGLRIFDWAEDYMGTGRNPNIRMGYWIDQTPEMIEVRRNRNVCAYCGTQEDAARGTVFCGKCIDSPYLKESDLYLTRMIPVKDKRGNMPPLSEAEKAHLLPLYRLAQTKGITERGKARIIKMREEIENKYTRTLAKAKREHDGMLWLMDHDLVQIADQNTIYYDHTGRFCFGWRTPLSADLVSLLLDKISEFPFPYDIKCADGRELSGD